ncbi:bifunctional phosphopantothenoylcysteine decarboxylase/phosphopantothenate--cysteine ligase CoaBC [Solemya velum gill symbiont]|uniref:bifunctional phosphopantothenoylcysteine decarboxylase/phosphopantothenate--cysteine ligase CoaBC n=1 Tax=Solemya velum gill symbiont TaxID=2340 RepID=UPI000998AACD|nr:bifunctional phosphopantothenoylcysteine decarboxylase/phosphopantothenate--cysteine ligase CoaBC [Solemya velum gill symbiont]OOZ46100.1 bifunctional 4'-phosphopantothenoylcysteine decarboxylase/phosphopantothenoylcysteine synthetase [Solemya velum gill symbiont]OOZ47588.1 bifunctional 4'-phosphopantothenoylcysteine decarboxylase/phosphopantothenoylcysteine synthetase [Solemya velum gill symbiont]OOZ50161.1 bifunctional 4'-phosphopantothenoylcysteine decarboxylase/phosphopantothenoylcysteine
MSLLGRHILLGVSGGIAAYKSAELARLLVKAGAEVRVVMTTAATEFVGPMTFQALTGHTVRSGLFDEEHEAAMGHIELARWADLVVIAPATADLMARLAHGKADDLLTTLVLATPAAVAIAPAMNQQMWADTATQANLERLDEREYLIWGPAAGEQACGDVGMGRMIEPAEIAEKIDASFPGGRLDGISAMVTAGPTYEAIDPVRFIGNRSSGKMGFAVARALVEQGAEVTLVAGPVKLEAPKGVRRIDVESAAEMHAAVMDSIAGQALFVASAAVADYRPADVADGKIKKSAQSMTLELVRNPDILVDVAALPEPPFCVGFAAETHDVVGHAEEKRTRKNLDMIAANHVGGETGGFDAADNALTVLWKNGSIELPMMDKQRLAHRLVELICDQFKKPEGDD